MNEINPQNRQNRSERKGNISKVNINLYNKISIINNHSTINSRLRKRKNQYIKNGGFGL